MGKLSNKQSRRLGGLLAILAGKLPRPDILDELLQDGFVLDAKLTERGFCERERLLTLAGLNVEAGLSRQSTLASPGERSP